MILLILLLSLIILLAYAFIRLFGDILAPAVIQIGTFVFGVFVAALNLPIWHADIQPKTGLVIFSALFVFLIGSILAYMTTIPKVTGHEQKGSVLSVSTFFYLSSLVLMIIGVLVYYRYVRNTSLIAGGDGGLYTFLGYYRETSVKGDLQEPKYITFVNIISGALATFYILIFANNSALNLKNYKYLLPVGIYSLSLVISSNRINFIYLAIAAITCLYLTRIWADVKTSNRRFIKSIGFSFGLFIIVFLLLGNLTGKTQGQDSLFQNISVYSGSSIVAFDDYLYPQDTSQYVSKESETLYGFSNLAKRTGLKKESGQSRFLEHRNIADLPVRTNIYTSFRRLIHDYGYAGLYIVQFLTGYITSALYLKVKRKDFNNIYLGILIYIFFLQSVALSFIDERIIVNTFTVTTIITFFAYFIFTRYFLVRSIYPFLETK